MHHNYCLAVEVVVGRSPGAVSARRGGLLAIRAGMAHASYNLAAFDPAPSPPDEVAAARDWFEAMGAPHRLLLRSGYDEEAIALALGGGYRVRQREPALAVAAAAVARANVAGCDVRRVTTPHELREYVRVEPLPDGDRELVAATAAAVAQAPGMVLLLGERGGRAAARALAVVSDDVVGVYNVFVREEERGRGLGRAITAAAVAAGRAAGATLACLQATERGLLLYLGMGFERVYDLVSLDSPVKS